MTKDELIAKAGEAFEFDQKLRVVPLDYALQALAASRNTTERDALAKIKAELAAIIVRLEEVG